MAIERRVLCWSLMEAVTGQLPNAPSANIHRTTKHFRCNCGRHMMQTGHPVTDATSTRPQRALSAARSGILRRAFTAAV
jgi:hypothetical protein